MRKPRAISRRQFVASAMSVAAMSSITGPEVFGSAAGIASSATGKMSDVSLTNTPPWRDQAIENLAVKPRLRQPVVVSFIHGKSLVSLPASMQGVKSWYVSYPRGLGPFRPPM